MERTVLDSLARRLAGRHRAAQRWRAAVLVTAAAAGLSLVASTVRNAWVPALPLAVTLTVLGLLWAATLGWLWWRARANAARLILLADQQVAGEEQLATAYELHSIRPQHPFLPLLLNRCQALVPRVDVARLIPYELSRPAVGALLFATAALVLFLLPPTLLQVSLAEEPSADLLIVEEGERLKNLAARLEEIARREGFESVRALAKELREVSEQLQSGELSAVDAAQRMQELSELAEELIKGDPNSKLPNFGGETLGETDPSAGGEEPDPDAQGEAAEDRIGLGGRGPENLLNRKAESEAVRGAEQDANKQADGDDFGKEPPAESPYARKIRDPERRMELEVLERTQLRLKEASRELLNQFISQDNPQQQPDPNSPPQQGEGDPSGQQMYQQSDDQIDSVPNPGMATGPDGEVAQESSEAPSQSEHREDRDSGVPESHGFEDVKIEGIEGEEPAEEFWVQQLPTLNARKIRADGTVPQFQRTTITAQSGTAVPRAYRSVVKTYYLELDRLTGEQKSAGPR